MVENIFVNNRVLISGEILSDFEFSHEQNGRKFYLVDVSALRISGTPDIIPVMVSDQIISKGDWQIGKRIKVIGQFRSYNKRTDDSFKMLLFVFAMSFEPEAFGEIGFDKNYICLYGYICRKANYRETPLGRTISDFILAVNRSNGRTDYIPCICWGRNAGFVDSLDIGTHIMAEGRIQSREYRKKISDDDFEVRVAYEVSLSKMSVVEEAEDETDESKK